MFGEKSCRISIERNEMVCSRNGQWQCSGICGETSFMSGRHLTLANQWKKLMFFKINDELMMKPYGGNKG